MTSRIGIYAGAFDPVHTGHIVFALQAVEKAELDRLYFLPERKPRHKQGVEHYGHRVAMLNRASKPHPKFSVLELDDISFTIRRTLPGLQNTFEDSQLVFLIGSDVVGQLPNWDYSEKFLQDCELVVSVRAEDDADEIKTLIAGWKMQPKAVCIFDSLAPEIASSTIRRALRANQEVSGALSSVRRYSNQNWLYVSVEQ